jgi:hypothetical protein
MKIKEILELLDSLVLRMPLVTVPKMSTNRQLKREFRRR